MVILLNSLMYQSRGILATIEENSCSDIAKRVDSGIQNEGVSLCHIEVKFVECH